MCDAPGHLRMTSISVDPSVPQDLAQIHGLQIGSKALHVVKEHGFWKLTNLGSDYSSVKQCNLGKITQPLCASISSCAKWG